MDSKGKDGGVLERDCRRTFCWGKPFGEVWEPSSILMAVGYSPWVGAFVDVAAVYSAVENSQECRELTPVVENYFATSEGGLGADVSLDFVRHERCFVLPDESFLFISISPVWIFFPKVDWRVLAGETESSGHIRTLGFAGAWK